MRYWDKKTIMIKKTKNYPHEIASEVRKALEYNKENPNNQIKMTRIEISKGLFNCGSIAISDSVCHALGIKPCDAPFTTDVHDNDWYFYVLFTYK